MRKVFYTVGGHPGRILLIILVAAVEFIQEAGRRWNFEILSQSGIP
jgi:hypothetical protein